MNAGLWLGLEARRAREVPRADAEGEGPALDAVCLIIPLTIRERGADYGVRRIKHVAIDEARKGHDAVESLAWKAIDAEIAQRLVGGLQRARPGSAAGEPDGGYGGRIRRRRRRCGWKG